MTSSAAIFGTYFVLFLVVSVAAQEVPDESTEVDEGAIATLNATDSYSLNSTTEERPSKCKEILQGFVDESVNSVSNIFLVTFRMQKTIQFDDFRHVH